MPSPQMMRMLGFFGSAARVTPAVINNANVTTATNNKLYSIAFCSHDFSPDRTGLCLFAEEKRAARFSSRLRSRSAFVSRLLGRVALPLLELLHDLVQVIARRILHRRVLLVGLELLQPQHLADGQQVPVVYVSRDRPGERA